MRQVPEAQLATLRQNLLEDSQVSLNYLFLTVTACLIATGGLLLGSPAVIIGAMIVAPLMLPMRGLALGALEGDLRLFRRSIISVAIGALTAIALSWTLGRITGVPETEFSTEILARTQPTLIDLGIAVTAGAVGGFAKIRPQLSDALAGTAISVALMPPLCVVGLGLSTLSLNIAQGAFLLYLTNLLGITLACMLVFVWGGYYVEGSRMTRALSSTMILTGLLFIPLAASFWQLLRQVQLQSTLKDILLRRTITVGQQVELTNTKIDWQQTPPMVYLDVRVRPHDPLTPVQVAEVQKLVNLAMRRPFVLIFRAEEIQEIRAQDENAPTPEIVQPAPQATPAPSPSLPEVEKTSKPSPTPASPSPQATP
ncbi:MAG TPA: DUF389 domain-containing protein [Oscillatoriales cyanobacterium M59_W2019_021]|nr:MAG: DUF389 domain-containing protein [Cyanobacteria bacterium J055]HIK33412.1 DUF389 domain-containing protein [Oscillatoriales cyanobacterium M4454_W2019_049]HIK49851.1 DUF389 domain-containing protein [Oscillatoriales cyanobacterium M59_W2019_021]